MGLECGLIGCGKMGRGLAEVIRDKLPEARVTTGFDAHAPTLEAFCREFEASPAGSMEELLGKADLDAVLIASPNHRHREHTVAAAAAGKHVFCEKPMALSVADCDRMMAACEGAGVKLMVGHSMRLNPLVRRLREEVAGGELGDLIFGLATYFFSGFAPRESGLWHVSRESCGGLFFQMAIHNIDLFLDLFGPARRVHYSGGRYGKQVRDFDDAAGLMLEFAAGGRGMICTSSLSSVPCGEMRIICAKGFVRLDSPWTYFEFGREEETLERVEAKSLPGPGAYEMELGSFVDWVLRDAEPVLTAREGRAAVAVAEATQKAEAGGGSAEVAVD